MKDIKCKLKGCKNKFGGNGELPLYCPDHNDMNQPKENKQIMKDKYWNILFWFSVIFLVIVGYFVMCFVVGYW